MLRNIGCTGDEAHRVPGESYWDVTLDEFGQFVGLVIAKAILGLGVFPGRFAEYILPRSRFKDNAFRQEEEVAKFPSWQV